MKNNKNIFLLLISLIIVFSFISCDDNDDESGDTNLFLSDKFLNIAHRGGRNLMPEETLIAFQNSLDVGADVLELDLHATSDGVIVAMHDETVDRTTDGTGTIKGRTYEELLELDAGYWFTNDRGATYPYRGQGITVPTLEEILTEFAGEYMVIEIKQYDPPITEEVMELIFAYDMQEKVIMGSFIPEVQTDLRESYPDILTSYNTFEVLEFMGVSMYDEDYVPPAEFLQVPVETNGIEVINQEFIDKARYYQLMIQVWTINDRDEMNDIIDFGVDGIMTDDPLTLAEVISERNL